MERPELTVTQLESMRPDKVFAIGMLWDCTAHVNLAGTLNRVLWVAQCGGAADWCIYAQNPHYGDLAWGPVEILKNGDKVFNLKNIVKLVPCTAEALERYRY